MSLLGTIALAAVPVVGIPGLALRFLAPVVFKRVANGAMEKAKGIDWKKALPIIGVGAALVYILILRGEVSHRDKIIVGQAAWEKAIVGAVSKGVGKPVPKDHAAAQIDAAFANVKTMSDALDRQNAALKQSATDAAARNAAAKAAVEPTSEQKVRETTRKALVDPKRSTGLTDKEWGQL